MDTGRLKRYAIIAVAAAIALEVFVFNFRALQSISYKPQKIEQLDLGNGISEKEKNVISIGSNGDKYIELKNIDYEAENIYLDIKNITHVNDSDVVKKLENQKIKINLYASDEGNAIYYKMPERVIASRVERSKYLKLNLYGACHSLKIEFMDSNNTDIQINSIELNKPVPFSFNLFRVLLQIFVMLLIYFIRPSSPYYSYNVDFSKRWQLSAVIAYASVQILVLLILTVINPLWYNSTDYFSWHNQYQELTEALLDGHFYLDEKVPQALIDMENPYDYNKRLEVMSDNNAHAPFDVAYYDGRYYVYFGVVPVLLLYLPYYLLTGVEFNTSMGVFICCALVVIGVLLLLKQIVQKWFPKTPFIIYMLMSFMFINGSGIIKAASRSTFYNLPIVMGLAFSVLGLYFWLSSFKLHKSSVNINSWRLCMGSLFMALVAGCRPQMLLGSFLAIPIFYDIVFKRRELFSKKSIAKSIAFAAPFVIVAAFLMYYNYARFGSPFDFGAKYNLTINDMTKRGFRLDRVGLGIMSYFLQLPVVNAKFPYVSSVYFYNNYMGVTISEVMFGGIFACYPILCANMLIFKLKKELKSKKLLLFCSMSIIFSFIIAMADTQIAGILARYYTDFNWFMWLSCAVIIFLSIEYLYAENNKLMLNTLFTAMFVCFVFSALYAGAFSITDRSNSIKYLNPTVFYNIEYFFEFWL